MYQRWLPIYGHDVRTYGGRRLLFKVYWQHLKHSQHLATFERTDETGLTRFEPQRNPGPVCFNHERDAHDEGIQAGIAV